MNDFRRRASRIDTPKLMYVGLDGDNGGILLNASEGGIAVRIVHGLPLHSRVQLQLRVPGKLPINAVGEVVWADGSRRLGIRFLEMSDDSRLQLRDWVLGQNVGPLNENPVSAAPELLFTENRGSQMLPAQSGASGTWMKTTSPVDAHPNPQPTLDVHSAVQLANQDAVEFESKSQNTVPGWKPSALEERLPSRRLVPLLAGIAIVLVCGMVGLYLRTTSAHAKAINALVESPVRHGMTPATVSPQPSQTQAQGNLAQANNLPLITAIQARPAGTDSTTVEIELGSGVKYTANRLSSPDRIYFDIEANLAPQLWGKASSLKRGPVVKFRSAQRAPGITRVTLQTSDLCVYSAMMRPDPSRLVVEVRKHP